MTAPLTEAWRASLGAQDDVARLVGTLELVEGFAVCLLLTPSPEVTAAVLEVVRAALQASRGAGWRLVTLAPDFDRAAAPTEQELVDQLLLPLTARRAKGEGGPGAVLLDLSGVAPRSDEVVGRFFLRLNRARETVRQRLACPLLLAMPARLAPVLAAASPDVNSGARSFAVAPPAPALDARTRRALERMPHLLPEDVLELFPHEDATHVERVPGDRATVRLDGRELSPWVRAAAEGGDFCALTEAARTKARRDPRALDTLVEGLRGVALDLARRDLPAAVALHRAAAELLATPRGDEAPPRQARHDRALHLNRAGDLLRAAGRAEEALALYREAYEVRLRLFEEAPGAKAFRELARSAHRVAGVRHARGETTDALVTLDEATRRLRTWRRSDELAADTLRDAVLLLLRAGVLRLHGGDTAGARAGLDEARRGAERLILAAPHLDEYRLDYALTRVAMAVLCGLEGDAARAADWWWEGQVEVEAIRQRRPGDPAVERLAEVYEGNGKGGESERARAA